MEEGKILLPKRDRGDEDLHSKPFPCHDVGVIVLKGDTQLDVTMEEEKVSDTPSV